MTFKINEIGTYKFHHNIFIDHTKISLHLKRYNLIFYNNLCYMGIYRCTNLKKKQTKEYYIKLQFGL